MAAPEFALKTDAACVALLDKAALGGWLEFEEGLHLYRHAETVDLCAASARRMQGLWGSEVRTYLLYHLLNYSNQCALHCGFCAYRKNAKAPGAWLHDFEALRPELERFHAGGGRVILYQGACDPEVPSFSWYTDWLATLRRHFPDFFVFGASPTEVEFWADKYGLSVPRVIAELKAAGLRAIAGAGAEIAEPGIRKVICPEKGSFERWIEIMEEAGAQGLASSASMMYGTLDGLDPRFEAESCRLRHMDLLRRSQGRGANFRAFNAWPYQPVNGRFRKEVAPYEEYVRALSIARLYLRNFPNIQGNYLYLSKERFGDSLRWAVNCSGGVLFQPELVTGAAGARPNHLSRLDIEDWISSAGFRPEERDYHGRLFSDPYPYPGGRPGAVLKAGAAS